MTDVQRIRYITERYNKLQGLRLLPIALLFGLLAGRELTRDITLIDPPGDLLFRGADLFGLLALVLIGVSFWLVPAIGQWYAEHYGTVKEEATDDRILLVIVGVLLAASWVDVRVTGVSVFGLTLAVLIAAHWLQNQRQWHYLAAAGVTAVLSLIPGVNTLGMALAGMVILVVVGIADHLMLVRALGPVEED